jgi:hypothetical protein
MKMQRINRVRSTAIFVVAAMCVLAASRETAVGGIQGSGIRLLHLIGRITGFGSIYVNGVEYFTTHANVTIDGRPGTETELQAGQIVTLEGTVNDDGRTGEASQVEFFGDVVGPVAKVDVTERTFHVLGQTIQVAGDTLFGGSLCGLGALATGSYVEVSGFADSRGHLVAARVDLVAAERTPQVRGDVHRLRTKAQSFHVNGLEVNYGGATIEGRLKNGADVKVQGRLAGATLLATSIEVVPDDSNEGRRGDVEGIVTRIDSAAVFAVDDQPVILTPKTKLSLHGNGLILNLPVIVEGTFDRAGVLVARKVTAKPHSSIALHGPIESIAGNVLLISGRTVRLSATTIFEDHSALELRTLTSDDLRLGDYVEVTGIPASGNSVLASTLRRGNAPGGLNQTKGKAKGEQKADKKKP